MPRQPIISVLGHVNSGKTSFLDAIRESKITEGEDGGITQMIGATEIPMETLNDVCGNLLNQLKTDLTIPGLMFIDTPGHAAFSSLRKRGGSISDIAVLMIDIEEGIQPQTEEAINILKDSNTPFIVGLNKIDKLNGWRSDDEDLFTKAIQKQQDHVKEQLDTKIYETMGELNEYDLVADRFDRVDDFKKKIAMVPMSAKTGVGIPELLMTITGLSQRYLKEDLEAENTGIGKATVLEVAKEKGMGTTIDVIHYDGTINKNEKLVYGTADEIKETKIRSLLKPRALTEIRQDKQYNEIEKVTPASGLKISARDLEGVISGSPIRTTTKENIEQAKKEIQEEIETVTFETETHGIVLKADSLGSLEAMKREVEKYDIMVQKAEVGPINNNDLAIAQDEEKENKAIFAFNVGLTENAKQIVNDKDVEVFQSKVIYEIIENYNEWKEQLQEKEKQEKISEASRPAKIRLMPEHVFRSSNPAVVGTKIEEGVLKPGTTLMTLEGEKIGRVKSIQEQGESIEKAEKGSEVATSISNATIGRNIEEGQTLLTDIQKKDYKILNELEDLLSTDEKRLLDEIVDLKDSINPHWKI